MENNLRNKAAFFLLYYGQQVFCSPMLGKQPWHYDFENYKEIDHGDYVLLKSLNNLTDNDAIEVANSYKSNIRHIKTDDFVISTKELIRAGKETVHRIIDRRCDFINPFNLINAYKKLISMGYYIGDGTEINFNWVKINEQ